MPEKVHTVKTIFCLKCGNKWRICNNCFDNFGNEKDHCGDQAPRTRKNGTVNFCSKCSN